MNLSIWKNTVPFYLEDADTPNDFDTFFIDTDKDLPCVVVLPGGGYCNRAAHEGAPIAEAFNSKGMHAVVVNYRVAPNRFPSGLADVQRVIRILRHNANEWHIDPHRIVTCGFSAGGHLAASSILYDDVYSDTNVEKDDADTVSHIPSGAILCYPVISVENDFGHAGSGKYLLGEKYESEKKNFFLAPLITESTPKVFLWHTSDDGAVNVKNSLVFGEYLRDRSIPFEMHIYPHGKHGLGLAQDKPDVCEWISLAANWINRNI